MTYIHLYSSPSTKWPAPRWLDSLVGSYIERCTRIAEVMGWSPVEALISQLLKLIAYNSRIFMPSERFSSVFKLIFNLIFKYIF